MNLHSSTFISSPSQLVLSRLRGNISKENCRRCPTWWCELKSDCRRYRNIQGTPCLDQLDFLSLPLEFNFLQSQFNYLWVVCWTVCGEWNRFLRDSCVYCFQVGEVFSTQNVSVIVCWWCTKLKFSSFCFSQNFLCLLHVMFLMSSRKNSCLFNYLLIICGFCFVEDFQFCWRLSILLNFFFCSSC